MKKSAYDFVVDQWSTVPAVETADLTGQTVVVVGANTGIGLEAAKHFAKMNPKRLIIGCRSFERGNAALEEIKKETDYLHTELWLIDLTDFSTVKAFADRFNEEGGKKIDILVMNAGILKSQYLQTADGWEETVQVNHLSTALLSILLLPNLCEQGNQLASRLVIVSSDVHYWAEFQPEILNSKEPLRILSSKEYSTPKNMKNRYFETKLLNVFFVRALSAHLSSRSAPTVVAVNPGFCYSQLRRSMNDYLGLSIFNFCLEKAFARTSEQGGRQLVYGAVHGRGDEEEKMHGSFVSRGQVEEVADFALSEEGATMQSKVWDETIGILSHVSDKVECIEKEFLNKDNA
ncbi:hypothetical protein BJ138DRAFT_1174848 [Hygrophoropsis aurantiaca]|uniref:Uncharacterized protein n=1 Tax=Hygrophoropsis aurantiaca TaxID=72124 RepID=A0ACB7ZZQ8_9AGAM|nr:hypothetical protein BJ138DRAFT_1174848 [Hygrophoropsis aurantiaca]